MMAVAWRKRVRAASKFGRRLSVNGDAGAHGVAPAAKRDREDGCERC